MFKSVQYALQPVGLEQEFLASRLSGDKRKLARVFWLALFVMVAFALVGLILVPASDSRTSMNLARLVGIAVLVLGLFSLRRISSKRQLDWVAFGCLGWVIGQVLFGHYLSVGTFEAMVAWDVFIVFLLYLAIPVSVSLQTVLALVLSIASLSIWVTSETDTLTGVGLAGVAGVYLAANIFGFICSVQGERAVREEFELLANEKRLKGSLESALTRVESMADSRNQIFRILAHDLRGSIGGLETIGRLLSDEEEQDEEERQELIDLLCDSSKSSRDLLEDLLQWALCENGGLDSDPVDVQLSSVVAGTLDFLAVVARNKRIELSSHIDESVIVSVDPKMLDTIVRNLVSNAIKFTRPPGSVRIACKDREDGFVEVSVEDTGVGIDEGRLPQLFHLPRGKSSLGTEGERGTNLGLRICADFVARQGGSIEVTSEVGVGSRFSFTLPMSRTSPPGVVDSVCEV